MHCPAVNYFTCTLGQAKELKRKSQSLPSFISITHMIEDQAARIPDAPAFGLSRCSQEPASNHGTSSCSPDMPGFFHSNLLNSSGPRFVTFRQLRDSTAFAAQALRPLMQSSRQTVGLLSTSDLYFLVVWAGLIRLGYSVLLLAPQSSSHSIEHLCNALDVNLIVVHTPHGVAHVEFGDGIHTVQLPRLWELLATAKDAEELNIEGGSEDCDPPFYFHTSGTSSGLPKPIPQGNSIVAALPRLDVTSQPATFSTTPLYHGGLLDCLRSWSSGAMMWLFPEAESPITARNIVRSLNICRRESPVPVQYFSSVPYVLQMLAEYEQGVRLLQTMNLVGVGGAALSTAVGDRLVEAGINLLSRFGSAECGFLASSHRDYTVDKEWQYLRFGDATEYLKFESRNAGLGELIVRPSWPSKAKTNRSDGSYATSDLFTPHYSVSDAWMYHSRSDAQIVLSNGKKFDPSPVESELLSTLPQLRDAYIFGDGRPQPGVLLFPSDSSVQRDVILAQVWPTMNQINSTVSSHVRIAFAMMVVVHIGGNEITLEKSSKGTTLRRQAECKYSEAIGSAYNVDDHDWARYPIVSDADLPSAVLQCVSHVVGREIDHHTDLFRQGVDSMTCIQIRKALHSSFLARPDQVLPLNVVYDQGTVAGLVSYLHCIRDGHEGNNPSSADGVVRQKQQQQQQHEYMRQLVHKYQVSCPFGKRQLGGRTCNVVLTGATGFLGGYILDLLRRREQIGRIYCLVRATTADEAQKRVSDTMFNRGWQPLGPSGSSSRIVCVPYNADLGRSALSSQDREEVLRHATVFIHASWAVNFNLRLKAFGGQLAGTQGLLELAMQADAKFVLVSSAASVALSKKSPIGENISNEPKEASPLGYSASKWVAEQMCAAADNGLRQADGLAQSSVSIVRVGQLCGDQNGAWNMKEAFPLLLSAAVLMGGLPDMQEHQALDWLPVQVAAEAILDVSLPGPVATMASEAGNEVRSTDALRPEIYHVLNPDATTTWGHLTRWIADEEARVGNGEFAISPLSEWLDNLEARSMSYPAFSLLGFWRDTMIPRDPQTKVLYDQHGETPRFDISRSRQASPAMRRITPLSRRDVVNIWNWIKSNETNG